MCGIIGIISKKPIDDTNWLSAGSNIMSHRGPDDSGAWWSEDKHVGLAHLRLSIIDLSEAGRQPMTDSLGMLRIVFNGEIYNYNELRIELSAKGIVFHSKTDTEVILAAYKVWGTECLPRLNGMFAFALYDISERTLFMARDRIGEKPLFYSEANGVLRFASELKAFMIDSTQSQSIDMEALDCYLAMGYVPGERCILKGTNKLPPAHALTFDIVTGVLRQWQYWKIPQIEHQSILSRIHEDILLNELEALLQDAVHKQLYADVPVGILLSGGVDSSLITAMAVKSSSKVKTFTIRFPGHGKLDETEHARLIARHFNTEHVELEAHDLNTDLFIQLAQKFDEPIIDSSLIPTYLANQLVRQYCTVALGGDGGDELFGGYKHYNRILWMQKHLGKIPQTLRRWVSFIACHFLPVGMKGRNYLQECGVNFDQDIPLIATYFDGVTRHHLMNNQKQWGLVAEDILKNRFPREGDILQRATRMDLENYLVEDILVKVDRTSMLNSLEVRAPLLDYRLVEFAFSKVPSYLKATSGGRKILLKKLARRLLPQSFDLQRKQGFSIPLNNWLKAGPWRELFNDVLLDPQSIFDKTIVNNLLAGQSKGRNNGERLFGLVLFELWRREHNLLI